MNDLQQALAVIDNLEKLHDGWEWGEGKAMHPVPLQQARTFVEQAYGNIPMPLIAPHRDGNVMLEWYHTDYPEVWSIDFEEDGDSIIEYFTVMKHRDPERYTFQENTTLETSSMSEAVEFLAARWRILKQRPKTLL